MKESFGLAVVLYAALLTLMLTSTVITGRQRSTAVSAALVFLGGATVAQAILDIADLHPRTFDGAVATNIGYLLTSVAVLPTSAAAVRLHRGRWGSAALAVGCALLVVVSIRLHQTLSVANSA